MYARDPSCSLKKDLAVVFGASVGGSIAVCAAAPLIVPLLFGPEYETSVEVIWALAPGVAFLGLYRFLSNAEIVRGHKFGILGSCLIIIAADVLILIVLGAQFGAVGGAVAASVSYIFGTIYLFVHILTRQFLMRSNFF